MVDRRQISLPEDLCAAAEQRYAAQFPTLEELLEFVLREIVNKNTEALDQSEQEMIDQRLRELGYL